MTHWLISGRGQGRLFQKMMKMNLKMMTSMKTIFGLKHHIIK